MGGDTTNSPFLSVIFAPTNPINNSMSFLSGTGGEDYDYLFTRLYSTWLDKNEIYVQGRDYETINKTVPILREPWLETLPVNGTDGTQFHPNI